MRPLHVLHVITTLDRGGAEKALLALIRAVGAGETAGAGRQSVAYLKGAGELAPAFAAAGADVHDLDVRGLRAARSHRRLSRLLRETVPDVVHSHLFKADVLAAAVLGSGGDRADRAGRAGRAERPALVSTKHNVDAYLRNPLWRTIGRSAARRADGVIAVSEGVAAFLRETIGEPPAGIDVVRYGVPAPAVATTAPPRTDTILCIARFDEQKDHDTLFEAVRRLAALPRRGTRAGEPRRVRLVLLGRGPREDALRDAAARVPRDGPVEIRFEGFREDVVPVLDAADVVVLTSRWEGLGLALVEAGQRGRPVVATRVGGIPEVVRDGVNGLLVPPGDPTATAEALARVLDDEPFAARLAANGIRLAAESFSPERCARETVAVWRRAVARNERGGAPCAS